MRCTRRSRSATSASDQCDRCEQTNRVCRVSEPRPPGRKRGARGRYRGIEKAFRNLKSEMRKAKMDYEAEKLQDIVYSASDKVPGDFLPVSQLTGQNPLNTINRRFRLGALYFRARSPI